MTAGIEAARAEILPWLDILEVHLDANDHVAGEAFGKRIYSRRLSTMRIANPFKGTWFRTIPLIVFLAIGSNLGTP